MSEVTHCVRLGGGERSTLFDELKHILAAGPEATALVLCAATTTQGHSAPYSLLQQLQRQRQRQRQTETETDRDRDRDRERERYEPWTISVPYNYPTIGGTP